MTSLASLALYETLVGEPGDITVLDAASAAVRKYCGWHLSPELVMTLRLDGSGGKYLVLPTVRLNDVISVDNDGVTLDPAAVEWSMAGYLRLRSGCWTDKLRGVTVTIAHGFTQDEVPDLAVQTVMIAARIMTSPRGEKRTQVGAVSVEHASGGISLTDIEESKLALYKATRA